MKRAIKRMLLSLPVIPISCWLAFVYLQKLGPGPSNYYNHWGTGCSNSGIPIIVFIGFIPDKVKFINSLIERLIDWVFRKKGFNRSELTPKSDVLGSSIIRINLNHSRRYGCQTTSLGKPLSHQGEAIKDIFLEIGKV